MGFSSRAEWIDAKFISQYGKSSINCHRINEKGGFIEILERVNGEVLGSPEMVKINLGEFLENPELSTLEGLPLLDIKRGHFRYWGPLVRNRSSKTTESASRLYADFYYSGLGCGGYINYSDNSLGGRALKPF